MKSYKLVIRPEADAELDGGARWYEARTRGLGREFLRAFRAATEPLRRNPFMYHIVVGEARRVLLRRFPYSIFYEVHGFRRGHPRMLPRSPRSRGMAAPNHCAISGGSALMRR